MDSNHRYRIRNNPFWLPPFGPAIRLPQQNRLFRAGDRWFESISLQQRVCLSCDFIFVVKNPGFPRGFPGCVPGAGREPRERQRIRELWDEG
jgi:hypothetical protein